MNADELTAAVYAFHERADHDPGINTAISTAIESVMRGTMQDFTQIVVAATRKLSKAKMHEKWGVPEKVLAGAVEGWVEARVTHEDVIYGLPSEVVIVQEPSKAKE